MILSDTAIRRPVLTTMVILAINVFGAISFQRIGIDLFPRVEFPVITVLTTLPGADPETVETTVTNPIEDAIATISAIKHLRSTSSDGVSQVIIEFELDKDIDVAYQEVQAKLGTVRSLLPQDIEDPIVEKFDIDASPILAVLVSGPLPDAELTRIADDVVKGRLQALQHVGQVKLVGARDQKIWIKLERDRLEGHGLSVQDVIAAVQTHHVELPGGRLETGPQELVVKTKAELPDAAAFSRLEVAYVDGAAVRLGDLGRVEEGLEERRSIARLDGRPAIALLVRRQSGTNTVAVARRVKREVERLRTELAPLGIRLEIAQDTSPFIEQSVHEVQFHLLFGGALAILIVLVFLRNLRSTFISSLVIPTAVIGTFVFMNAAGFTQNMMTLLALSLSIGLLIDDAIVVQENIMRHVEAGKPPREAARFATSEIGLAVLATTLSVVAVFVPVAFMEGLVGRFFYQFGLTVAIAVLISMFVSFTLDPMLSSRLLRKPRPGRLHRLSEAAFVAIERVYERLLARALSHRLLVFLIAALAFAAAAYLGRSLRSEFLPLEDQSEFNIKVKAPLGASLGYTDAVFERVRKRLADQPWLEYTFSTIGADELERVNEGVLYVKLKPKRERTLSQQQIMAWAREHLADIEEARLSVEIVPRVQGGGRKWADVQLEVRGSELGELARLSGALTDFMNERPGFADIDTSYEPGKPQLGVYVDRERAADLGVDPLAIGRTVRALIGGLDIAKFKRHGERYDVGIRLVPEERARPEHVAALSIRSRSGALIKLENVATIRNETSPVQIDHYNRRRQITLLANLERDKLVLGEAISALEERIGTLGLPPGYSYGFAGMAENMKESFANLLFALGLAVVMVYMLLASQFESFIHPLTIMLTLPLSLVGAIGALLAFDMTMSIFTMIGIIMLMGLVTKNAILVVDFANTLRERDGLERREAVLRAGVVRLRPILMTTFAMIFGMLPIALGTGSGSESRAPMAMAVIGGLSTSTLLSLVVVPVAYEFFDDVAHPLRWWRRRRKSRRDTP